ncbi:MAG: helix-turn-helix domain-containing protein [bacterium]|nr:helix-turn-helix domain-containing protein [bacterium]
MWVAAGWQRYNDIDLQVLHLGNGDAYQQLDCGFYDSVSVAGESDGAGCYIERTNRQLARQGRYPSHIVLALVLLTSSDHAILNGSLFSGDDVILVGPGSEYESFTPAGHKPAVFYMRLESETNVPLLRLANQQAGRIRKVADPELAGRFRVLAANFLHSWDKRTTSISIPQSALQGLMFELLTSPSAANGSSHPSIQIYRAARDVMLDALAETLTIPELASRVGTSRRTLEKTFDDCVSVSPARFHKLLRLNNARRLLLSGQHSVSRAATSSGLYHLGRFSGDYHSLFGELPSQTAQRARTFI